MRARRLPPVLAIAAVCLAALAGCLDRQRFTPVPEAFELEGRDTALDFATQQLLMPRVVEATAWALRQDYLPLPDSAPWTLRVSAWESATGWPLGGTHPDSIAPVTAHDSLLFSFARGLAEQVRPTVRDTRGRRISRSRWIDLQRRTARGDTALFRVTVTAWFRCPNGREFGSHQRWYIMFLREREGWRQLAPFQHGYHGVVGHLPARSEAMDGGDQWDGRCPVPEGEAEYKLPWPTPATR